MKGGADNPGRSDETEFSADGSRELPDTQQCRLRPPLTHSFHKYWTEHVLCLTGLLKQVCPHDTPCPGSGGRGAQEPGAGVRSGVWGQNQGRAARPVASSPSLALTQPM